MVTILAETHGKSGPQTAEMLRRITPKVFLDEAYESGCPPEQEVYDAVKELRIDYRPLENALNDKEALELAKYLSTPNGRRLSDAERDRAVSGVRFRLSNEGVAMRESDMLGTVLKTYENERPYGTPIVVRCGRDHSRNLENALKEHEIPVNYFDLASLGQE